MKRRDFLSLAGMTAFSLVLTGCDSLKQGRRSQTSHRKPNIIFILADDLHYTDLSCYGQDKITTPNIDEMAAEGLRFVNAYSGGTVCAPSRCCLMTGYHTGHAAIRSNAMVPLPDETVTVAEVLKNAGYTSGVFGKWGLGDINTTGHPLKQGFDQWFGFLDQKHAWQYFPEYIWKNEQKVNLPENAAGQRIVYSDDLIMEEALGFIKENKNKPFFVYLATQLPHGPVDANAINDVGQYASKSWEYNDKVRAAMVQRLDQDVAKVIDMCKELSIDNDTIIFFTGDNGGAPSFKYFDTGLLRGGKTYLYEGGIRVPMIVRWPGVIKAATKTEHMCANWDFLPTAADIAGIRAPDGIDGISLVPTLLADYTNQKEHKFLYWEYPHPANPTSQAVRMGKWKAIRQSPDAPIELYNLETDIGETTDVSDKHPKILQQANAIMVSEHTSSKHYPLRNSNQKK